MPLKTQYKLILPLALFMAFVTINSCNKDNIFYSEKESFKPHKKNKPEQAQDTITKFKFDSLQNVIVLVVDGARYADTWEAAGTPLITSRKALSKQGALCTSFYNNGLTLTVSGHTAIATGVYETLNNGGAQTPTYPSYMQAWRKAFHTAAQKAWVVTTKDKLEVLKNCTESKWRNTFNPLSNCGKEGLGTGYREDAITVNKVKEILTSYTPNLMLINLKQPDAAGHSGDSLAYVQGIKDSDEMVQEIWDFIQSNAHYKNKTALIITNDHGRHNPGHLDGFISHGDDCAGCRHIEFLALGPGFKQNYISTTAYSQIDIAPTIAYLLGFKMPFGNGKIMKDLLEK